MKIVTAAEMREIDRLTGEHFGVPSLTLMENAGTAVAQFALARYPSARRIGVICGKGNNGGDGLVAARQLGESGRDVQVLLLAEPSELHGDAAEMLSRLEITPLTARTPKELKGDPARAFFACEVLVDAILGTGFRPPVSELYAEAIAALNASGKPVLAVDIPSGADADGTGEPAGPMVHADAIVTFTAPRPAHILEMLTKGPTVICPIGSPDEAVISALHLNVITASDVAPLIAPRPADSNKGSFGHVGVVGGSLGKAGAVAMAGIAALRSGAGLATVAAPKSVISIVAGFHPEIMTEPLAETESGTISHQGKEFDAWLAGKTVLAVGPGISRHPETAEFVRALVRSCKVPVVLDADGLNAFDGRAPELNGKGRTLVITPHPGEMARLVGSTVAEVQRDRLNVARTFARLHEVIVVLKGHRTMIAHPDGTVWVNTSGNPGMATGGTGDILTGMVAGFIAQDPTKVIESVCAAVHLHGVAGDVARETFGEHSLIATDLLQALPEAFRRIRTAAQQNFVHIS